MNIIPILQQTDGVLRELANRMTYELDDDSSGRGFCWLKYGTDHTKALTLIAASDEQRSFPLHAVTIKMSADATRSLDTLPPSGQRKHPSTCVLGLSILVIL